VKAVHVKRLLNVARALEESPKPKAFSMVMYGYNGALLAGPDFETAPACGTPACAFGHYASRRDLQRRFRLKSDGGVMTGKRGESVIVAGSEHFGLNDPSEPYSDWDELFAVDGCGNAKTAKQAARYIRKFVARKQKAASR
jgi:hypothetical protein